MRKGKRPDLYRYARCIDCAFFGHQGAHCDIQHKQELCFSEACVFFQWKATNVLQKICASYFWPDYDYYRDEMELRGMKLGI